MEYYNGNFDILPGESENLWRMFMDYSEILYLFMKDYNNRNKELEEEEFEVIKIPELSSIYPTVIVDGCGFGGGLNMLRDQSVVSDYLSQVGGLESLSRKQGYSASSYEFYRLDEDICPRGVCWASNKSRLVIIELLYGYCDDDTNRTLSVVDSGANSRYLSEINRRISEMKSVGHYPVDRFIRKLNKYSFVVPHGDWWLKSNYMNKIYCGIHKLIGCVCLGRLIQSDIESILRRAIIKRFSKYCRLDRVSEGNGVFRVCLEVMNRVKRTTSLVLEVDKWIYRLINLYSELSYWVGSLGYSLVANKSVELIWLMGYSQSYLLCPKFFEVYEKFNIQYGCFVPEIRCNGLALKVKKRKYKRIFQNHRSSKFKGRLIKEDKFFSSQ